MAETFLTDEVGRKYRILDAKTGAEKAGAYFVLRLDAASRDEQIAVRCALDEYVRVHKAAGNCPYANRVAAWVLNPESPKIPDEAYARDEKIPGKLKEHDVEPGALPLRGLAARLRAAVDTTNYPKGYPEIKPSLRDSSALARDLLLAEKILKAVAGADAYIWLNNGKPYYAAKFGKQAVIAAFNARLLANNRKPLKMEEKP